MSRDKRQKPRPRLDPARIIQALSYLSRVLTSPRRTIDHEPMSLELSSQSQLWRLIEAVGPYLGNVHYPNSF
jgi:hypothetical protein